MSIKLSINNIPEWIINNKSKLYDNLDSNNYDDFIIIPKNKYEEYINILYINDLYKYLDICRFWMLDQCPHNIYEFVFNNKKEINIDNLEMKFYDYIDIIKELKLVKYGTTLVNSAACKGNLNLLKFCFKLNLKFYDNTINYTMESGNIECVKYLREIGATWDENTTETAAVYGFLEGLIYAHKNGCHWDEETCSGAAMSGNIECLKYAHKNGCPWNEKTIKSAIRFNKKDCLVYAIENKCPGYENYLFYLINPI